MADKLIKNVDEKVWRKFVVSCFSDGIRTGDRLSDILKEYLRRKND
jgi:hypothetical protein